MTERELGRFADPLEVWLAAGLAVEPVPAVAEQIDRRVRAAIVAPVSLTQPRLRFGRRTKGLFLLAAAIAVMGAAAGALGLFTRIVPSEPGWQLAWDRGAQLGLTATAPGAQLTLERAYGDANEVVVFLLSKDAAGTANLFANNVSLTDADGRSYGQQLEIGDTMRGFVAHVVGFATPEPWLSGERSFTLTVTTLSDAHLGQERTVAGPWTLRFSITSAGGWVGAPGPAVTRQGATVELRSIVVSPAMIRGEILVTAAPALPPSFAPIATVTVGGHTIDARDSVGPDGTGIPGVSRFSTLAGVNALAGPGAVTITELVGFDPDPDVPQVRLAGPWLLGFDLP